LYIGAKEVRLLNVGPAHTKGDTLTYLPAERTVYTGDIVFYEVHPLATSGSIQAWIDACDRILGWQVETVVPGHGPITDKSGVRRLKQYFEYLRTEARKRFDAGMRFDEAARDIAWDAFRGWADDERIYANVNAMYRDFGGTAESFSNVLAIARAHRNRQRLGTKPVAR
jgi:glyoxylase-like metal-dependent hydrolase (beta-lactamase superfamily II)